MSADEIQSINSGNNNDDDEENAGTSAIHVFQTILPIFFTTFFTVLVILMLNIRNILTIFTIEFVLVVCSIILNVTVLDSYISVVLIFEFLVLGVWALCSVCGTPTDGSEVVIRSHRPGYVTLARSSINLITAVCILAIDFKCFPSHFGKTESYGFGLMDTGIGLFVFGAAIVAKKEPFRNYKKILLNCLPLILLGVARTIVTKAIGYHANATEYGVHWNAFLTLGFTRLLAFLAENMTSKEENIKYIALAITVIHETILQMGLADYVMDVVGRENFFKANREGLTSLPGFVVIYLISLSVGGMIRSDKENISSRDFRKKMTRMASVAGFFWIAMFLLDPMFGVSRRICNMGYVAWTMSIGTSMLALFMILELFIATVTYYRTNLPKTWNYVPIIMESVNFNGLAFFLLANVLTGLVNMSFKTRRVHTPLNLFIIVIYMLTNCIVALILYLKKIKLKI